MKITRHSLNQNNVIDFNTKNMYIKKKNPNDHNQHKTLENTLTFFFGNIAKTFQSLHVILSDQIFL